MASSTFILKPLRFFFAASFQGVTRKKRGKKQQLSIRGYSVLQLDCILNFFLYLLLLALARLGGATAAEQREVKKKKLVPPAKRSEKQGEKGRTSKQVLSL